MTTIVVWKTFEIERWLGNPAIWIISDSRATIKKGYEKQTLTNRCAKVFEVDIVVRNGDEVLRSAMLIAISGSATVAHNTIFCVQLALKYLKGESIPTALELAKYVRDVILDITKEVALSIDKNAMCEAIIAARDGPEIKVYSLESHIKTDHIDYSIEEVCEFPYVIGIDKDKYEKKFLEELKKNKKTNNEITDQNTIYIFDKIFVEEGSSQETGGELHIAAIGSCHVHTYRAMRWNKSAEMYEFYLFGMDTFDKKIGNSVIVMNPWQLEDKN